MGSASYEQTSFHGGELSKSYQGRYDLPAYRTSMAVCYNSFPIETGAWARRGGTQFCGTTRSGNPGRIMTFDVSGASPIYLEFTSLFLRFWLGPVLVTTNDNQVVASITTDNPAKVNTVAPHGWSTGNQVQFPGTGFPLLQNRSFMITVTSASQFTIADAITGASINGASLGSFTPGSAARVLEIVTNYGGASWSSMRSVQAETQTLLLNGSQPQVLTLVTPPTSIASPTFSLVPSNFLDGPYLDPFNGSICTYDLLSGNVTLTFSFQAYSATVSYNVGDFVTSGGQGYKSLTADNLSNTPAGSPANWVAVNGGAPVGPNGFTAADIGRHIRLFSEPSAWVVGTYSATNVVKYNGAYYQSVVGGNTAVPGTDPTKWAVVTGAGYALWTWGRIILISGVGLINPSVAIGNLSPLANAFDAVLVKGSSTCAGGSTSAATDPAWNSGTSYAAGAGVYFTGYLLSAIYTHGPWSGATTYAPGTVVYYAGEYWKAIGGPGYGAGRPPGVGLPYWTDLGVGSPANTAVWSNLGLAPSISLTRYAGQNFSSSTKTIAQATVFPSNDLGFGPNTTGNITLNLRAKHSAPANSADGTLLGTVVTVNTIASISIPSNDSATHWEYVWVEMITSSVPPLPDDGSHTYIVSFYIAQVEFFNNNIANGSVVKIQLAGPPLLYQAGTVVTTWRAGVYGNSAGWPTCGTYIYGRLWLSGVVGNRFDASNANQIFNFAPTGPDGTVSDRNAISYTLNAPDVNPIEWMVPDLQGILVGTQKREWLVQPASITAGISPTNIVATPATHIGCANIEPRHTDHTIVFVQKHQRKMMEFFPEVFSGKFTAPNLMEKARHLTGGLIAEIAYAQELTPTIWARCGDGSWFGAIYKRDTLTSSSGPTYIGFHRHALGSGRLVESIAIGPSPDGTLDALMMVSNDLTTSVRHVELLTDFFEETDVLLDAWQLDDAAVPTSTASSTVTPAPYGGLTLNGLWHLNGKTVQVFAGGLDCGAGEGGVITDFVVTNGSITIPYGDGVSAGSGEGLFTAAFVASFTPTPIPIVVGFTFTSQGQLLRPNAPQDTGARNGPGFGKKRRNHWFAIQTVNTAGLSIGTDFAHLDAVKFATDAQPSFADNQLFTGVWSDVINDTESFDGQICWQVTRPWPAMVAVMAGFIQTKDK